MSTTLQKVDLSKEDLILHDLFLSKANQVKREGKSDLTFVTFVGAKKFTATPSMLYFGDMPIEQLKALEGSKVDIQISGNDRGWNVTLIQSR